MFNLFKKNKKYPPFEHLKAFDKRYYYFIRTASWDWMDNKNIFVTDPHHPRIFTLDPWPQLLFLSADGEMTVTDFVLHAAKGYTKNIPDQLDETVIAELDKLVKYGIVQFKDKKERPEPRYDLCVAEWKKRGGQ